jgi:hypothetical protein
LAPRRRAWSTTTLPMAFTAAKVAAVLNLVGRVDRFR